MIIGSDERTLYYFRNTWPSEQSFFLEKGFLEVHTQNRLSILAACEDPTTVSTYNYAGNVWPLPQTGQMWLEHELLSKPEVPGFFCVSTSYRQEPNIIEGRHDLIFPMFEFEMPGTIDDLHKMAKALLIYETLTGDEIKDLIFKNIQPKAPIGNEDQNRDKEESSALGSLGLKPKPAI